MAICTPAPTNYYGNTATGCYVTPLPWNEITPTMWETYSTQIKQNIYDESPLLKHLKEAHMEDDVVHKAMRKRREKQATERIEWLDAAISESEYEDGSTVSWRVSFHDTPNKTYWYVALKGGAYWYVTGDSKKYTLDLLIEHIVELSMRGVLYFEDYEEPL